MKRQIALFGIVVLVCAGMVIGRGASPAGKVSACGYGLAVYKPANIVRWNTATSTYVHVGVDLGAWQDSCYHSKDTYYRVSTWKISGTDYYLFATLKVRAWNCNIYLGAWTKSSSGINLADSLDTPNVNADCLFQSDDYQLSLYSSTLTPGPGQPAAAFGVYLNINQT
jgi:hypothetical protein